MVIQTYMIMVAMSRSRRRYEQEAERAQQELENANSEEEQGETQNGGGDIRTPPPSRRAQRYGPPRSFFGTYAVAIPWWVLLSPQWTFYQAYSW